MMMSLTMVLYIYTEEYNGIEEMLNREVAN